MYLKMRGQETGFTIIELTLFLAISGLLLSVMFIGTGSLAARQRFTDSTDSLQAYVQAQYDEVANGVNVRSMNNECSGESTVSPGSSQKCLLIGKLLTLNGASVTSQYVISTSSLSGTETGDQARLDDAKLSATSAEQSTYDVKWGATTFNVTRSIANSVSRSQVNSIAFLRIPDSSRIVQLYYQASPGTATSGLQKAIKNDYTGAYNPPGSLPSSPSLSICVKNDNDFIATHPRSAIFLAQGNGASSVLTSYSPGAALCP